MTAQRIGRVPPTGALDPGFLQQLRPQAAQTTTVVSSGDQASISAYALAPRRRHLTAPLGLDAATAAFGPPRIDTTAPLLHVDPVASNQAITASYAAITADFRTYLGANAMSDWTALANNASTEAGHGIRQAREIRLALQTFTDGRVGGETQAVAQLYSLLQEDGAVSQGARMVLANLGLDLSTVGGLAATLIFSDRSVFEDGFRRGATQMATSLQNVERQLTVGNRAIYANIAPAYAIFLHAESHGQDGVKALQASRYVDAPLLIDAFRHYQLAHISGDRLQARQLVQRGNELIARHEQANILQTVIEPIRDELRQISPTLTYLPPGSTTRVRLLPNGGDWGDVETRLQAIAQVSRTFLEHDMAQRPSGLTPISLSTLRRNA